MEGGMRLGEWPDLLSGPLLRAHPAMPVFGYCFPPFVGTVTHDELL
jgi:hypothetical protein